MLGFCTFQELSPPNRHVWRLSVNFLEVDAPTRLAQEVRMNSWPNDTVSKGAETFRSCAVQIP